MIYKIRVILNTEEDVIRDIAIHKTVTLEDLHNAITNAFGFTGNEMASFYRSDESWVQGEEFPLFDMSDGANGSIQMQDITLENVLASNHDKLIYVYDFFTMWSFYVEVIETDYEENQLEVPSLLFSLGTVPANAPDVQFETEDLSIGDYEEEDEDEFDEFNFDNFDELMN
ncbi:MAG: plasmid pRiA4b ORF-3 family protein [Flavobacteriaceae bacterium]|nr:plasmid pRiA4b ORF-3 family protein [Flavobacteriaceae bacterium]